MRITIGRLLILFGSLLMIVILGLVGAGVWWLTPFALLTGVNLGILINGGAWSE